MKVPATIAMLLVLGSCGVPPVQVTPKSQDVAVIAAREAATAARSDASKVDGTKEEEPFAPDSMGAICWAAILESISEVGRRCPVTESPAFRAALNRSAASLDAHFRTAGGWTDQQIVTFRKQMGEHDAPAAALCANEDALAMHASIQTGGPDELDKTTAGLVARPGPPVWGTCL